MRMKILALTLCAAGITSPAFAAQGEICQSEPLAASMQQPIAQLTNEVKFNCPSIGEVKLPEVYQKGWRVVQSWAGMVPKPEGAPATHLPYASYHLIIEKI